jgi:hypothetical protein
LDIYGSLKSLGLLLTGLLLKVAILSNKKQQIVKNSKTTGLKKKMRQINPTSLKETQNL